MAAEQLMTQHLDLWTAAIKRRSTAGRGSSSKVELYGIKKLRELILELAVRGLLVPQDPNDEPASELLKKIASEKAKLVKEGKIKKEKPQPAISAEEQPFELPKGWAWSRLADLAQSQAGFAFKANFFNETGDGLPLIRIRDVGQPFSGTYYSGDYREEFLVEEGDYLISMDGNFRVARWTGKTALLNQRVSRLIFYEANAAKRFVADSLQLRLLELQGIKAYTTVDHLSGGQIAESVIAVPPLAEQHRIVAKVDELMALCDELEQQIDASLSAHQTLVETLLNALTSAADHAQAASSWQRIAEHFDTLFATEESIDQLKQTILQLAVMGKLVPQDPKDEPASEILKKIAAEKAKLVKEGKIKKKEPLLPIGNDEKPFELPKGWEWIRLGQSGIGSTGKTPSTKETQYFEGNIPFIGPGQISPDGELLEAEKYLSEAGLEESTEAISDDILMVCIGGSIGKAVIADRRLAFNQQLNAIRPIGISSKYLYITVSTDPFYANVLKHASGSATPIINRTKWEELLVPLCPKAEQHRIVAKVDELVALCDQLKSRLSAAEQLRFKLAEAVTDAALNPASGTVIPFPDAAAREARRHAIGCHAVAALKDHRSFGRTMLMKLIYLADSHVGAELAMEVERAAAGPFDQWIYRFEEHAEAEGWFGHEKTQGDKILYKPQTGLAVQAAKVRELLDAAQVAELDRVLKLFAALSTEDAEIIATLFAAWNDFLIDGHTPDDAEVIREVRENWTPEKQRFKPEQLQTWLDWIRKNKLFPRGRGPRTVQQTKLFY